jgi:tetratricopeptide (TPR) repeat protein
MVQSYNGNNMAANQTGNIYRPTRRVGLRVSGYFFSWPAIRAVLTLCAVLLLIDAAANAQDRNAEPVAQTIRGIVHDAAGTAIESATVLLLHEDGSGAEKTTTNAAGLFEFTNLASGKYLLSAEGSARRSPSINVIVPSPRDQQPIDLTLKDAAEVKSGTASSSAPLMEFADQPNFTIAAVTDWTAAGGHGSDAVLRTSEALTRETLTLTPEGGDTYGNGSVKASQEMEKSLRAALVNAPASFAANHRLGEFYLHAGQFGGAVAYLQAAYKAEPTNADNEYSLALALKGNGEFTSARDHVQKMIANKDNADLHRLNGELNEKLKDPLAAVHEFELAVREDPSERNYFEWGSDLLLHRAVWQAKDVFSAGAKSYPKSARMLTALGAALFAGALYDDAAQRLCEASDLGPADPEPYLFMGKIEMAAPNPLPCVEQKLKRFVDESPNDALANYFYAMTFWKQHGQTTDTETVEPVEKMLTKAVTIDAQCSDAYLQLGVLKSAQHDYERAIGYYSRAIEANPRFSEAHYRLGMAYDRVGQKEKAQREFQLHDEIDKQQKAAVEQQRKEVKQFLVIVDGKTAGSPSPE